MKFNIGTRTVGLDQPAYIIAELGSCHDGSLDRAKKLIELAKDSGAEAAKFQHYRADTLASRYGFEQLQNLAHYTENPYDVFKKYEIPWEWTPQLKEHCDKVGIEFMSTPYDLAAVGHLDPFVNVFKIGSGDITYTDLIKRVALTGKPVILSTGATTTKDMDSILQQLPKGLFTKAGACLMQCNTNYSGKDENIACANLAIIVQYIDGGALAGYSDHSHSLAVILGAVAIRASIIEAHFTDGQSTSPDNGPFAWEPRHFKIMVSEVRKMEAAFGDGQKKLEANEAETVILQRRCLRAARELPSGTLLRREDMIALRPAPVGSMAPYRASEAVGGILLRDVPAGDYVTLEDFQ